MSKQIATNIKFFKDIDNINLAEINSEYAITELHVIILKSLFFNNGTVDINSNFKLLQKTWVKSYGLIMQIVMFNNLPGPQNFADEEDVEKSPEQINNEVET